jgi:hypothetical protein
MIEKEHFFREIKKLETIFNDKLTPGQLTGYYEAMSHDFTNEEFTQTLNHVLKDSFKFPPPIAAFYKGKAPDVPDPVTTEEKAIYARIRERYEC